MTYMVGNFAEIFGAELGTQKEPAPKGRRILKHLCKWAGMGLAVSLAVVVVSPGQPAALAVWDLSAVVLIVCGILLLVTRWRSGGRTPTTP